MCVHVCVLCVYVYMCVHMCVHKGLCVCAHCVCVDVCACVFVHVYVTDNFHILILKCHQVRKNKHTKKTGKNPQ